jgi:hypothetical protein
MEKRGTEREREKENGKNERKEWGRREGNGERRKESDESEIKM